jgi:hypothetical protein
MPLYDHFHGPIARLPWEPFHVRWAVAIADDLNRRLPRNFVAGAPIHLGAAVEADVVEYEMRNGHGASDGVAGHLAGDGGGVAVATRPALATQLYTPPATDLCMPADFPPELYVEVRDETVDYQVVAVVELVSPGNKDRDGYRNQFAAKCLSYLAKGLGVVVLDIVTRRRANLHNALVRLAGHDPRFEMAGDPPTYAVAYRPVHRNKDNVIDLWPHPLAVGSALPAVPLYLKGYGCVRLDLEATYSEACERSRIP